MFISTKNVHHNHFGGNNLYGQLQQLSYFSSLSQSVPGESLPNGGTPVL